jgi:hypothetical protein
MPCHACSSPCTLSLLDYTISRPRLSLPPCLPPCRPCPVLSCPVVFRLIFHLVESNLHTHTPPLPSILCAVHVLLYLPCPPPPKVQYLVHHHPPYLVTPRQPAACPRSLASITSCQPSTACSALPCPPSSSAALRVSPVSPLTGAY